MIDDEIEREIRPGYIIICGPDTAMRLRAIRNESGHQDRADEPPSDNGAFTH